MDKRIFDDTTDFSMLQPCTAKNNIMGFETMALRVADKNLVHLSLIFESEVKKGTQGYYVDFNAKREDAHGGYVSLTVQSNQWIVILDGELRVLPDHLFQHAFTTDELIEFRCSVCGKISGDNHDGPYGEKHVAYQMIVGGAHLHNVLADCNMDLRV
jgi:hypothetical protein